MAKISVSKKYDLIAEVLINNLIKHDKKFNFLNSIMNQSTDVKLSSIYDYLHDLKYPCNKKGIESLTIQLRTYKIILVNNIKL